MDYHDPKIAEIYEIANPRGEDAEFYVSLAGPRPCSILDLGCGTGALCCALAERGHRVTGVDPSAAMLNVARRKPHADQVEWVESSAQHYRSQRWFDLVVMTGHAFQILLTDGDALAALGTMRAHLSKCGRVTFETRSPQVDWVGEWHGRTRVVANTELVETLEVTAKEGDFISFRTWYRSPHLSLSTSSTLRFPSKEHVEGLLARSGLVLREVFGDWNGARFEAGESREMIFVAGMGEAR